MSSLTRETIAVVFDFDDTLAPDCTSSLLASRGVDVPVFWNERVQALVDADWDPIPAYMYAMVEVSDEGADIRRDILESWGASVTLHAGVETIFSRLRDTVSAISEQIQLEFYMISSGLGDVLRHVTIADEFKDIWASDFSYDDDGRIRFPKKIVSFTDKTRYLFQISKGQVGEGYRGRPFEVNRKISREQMRIPFDQMIVVGDGYTDIPCFSMVRKNGGIAIGVVDQADRKKWGKAWGFIEDDRVSNLVPADYSEGSALEMSLMMAVESKARMIGLRTQTYQG